MKTAWIVVVTAMLITTSAATLADNRFGHRVGVPYADERGQGLLHVGDRSYIGSRHRGHGYGKGHGYKRDYKKDHGYRSGHRYRYHKRGNAYHDRGYRGRDGYRNSYRGGHERRYNHRDRRPSGHHYKRRGNEIFIGITGGSVRSGGVLRYRESR